ncbi:hypothetical protein Bca101_043367 [Brassica carinata]
MAKGLAPDTELLSSEGVSGKLQTQRDKQGDREYDTIEGAKGKTRREEKRGASGVRANASAGRKAGAPEHRSKTRSEAF